MEPRIIVRAMAALALLNPGAALACSSCGCSLSSDWATQGYAAGEGIRLDLRADYFNQNDLRSGTRSADRRSLAIPNEREVQQETINRSYLVTIDYGLNESWALAAQLPYFDRYHTTIAPGDDDISTSQTSSAGDLRLVARYQGLAEEYNTGFQLGVKLATGSFRNTFRSGPQAGEPLDRGLQPGTGTTDLLAGIYTFGGVGEHWEYFAQALVQQPLNSRDAFRPGTGLNVNFGTRYVANESITPQIQVNLRVEGRESGANADVQNSGATLAYLSPGVAVRITKTLQAYGFFQVPIYQRVNGLQIEPRYTVSVGLHYAM